MSLSVTMLHILVEKNSLSFFVSPYLDGRFCLWFLAWYYCAYLLLWLFQATQQALIADSQQWDMAWWWWWLKLCWSKGQEDWKLDWWVSRWLPIHWLELWYSKTGILASIKQETRWSYSRGFELFATGGFQRYYRNCCWRVGVKTIPGLQYMPGEFHSRW